MEFHPYEAFDRNSAQQKLWDYLRKAFEHDEGVAYYRYPIFTPHGRLKREPDIVILHRDLGLWVIECKGFKIDNIREVQGHNWQMAKWHREAEQPMGQAEDAMFALRSKLDAHRETRDKVVYHFRVALPFITREQWKARGYYEHPAIGGAVLLSEDLDEASLRTNLSEHDGKHQEPLSDQDWEMVKGVLRGSLPSRPPRDIPTGTSSNNPIRVIQSIESKLKTLDQQQQSIASEVPDGPQRLRGLAGTGKTVLLAKRVAKIHASHPDWKIAFVFFTRSLYNQILELIRLYCLEMIEEEPDWGQIEVLHAWGGRRQAGFYYKLAQQSGIRPKRLDDVREAIGEASPSENFEYICECLEYRCPQPPEIYDAIIIDEGQDLPPVFYRLAYKALREPKRLYWAYDEAQGIGSLIIPNPESIFGRTSDNQLVVNLSGKYKGKGGIQGSHRMKRCYRTPKLLLMTAHAINMGLFRQGGPLQGVSDKDDWEDLGYEVGEGADFRRVGTEITITRPEKTSPHPIDQEEFEQRENVGQPLTIATFTDESEEQEWIAEQVAHDLSLGFNPEDIMITSLVGDYDRNYLRKLKQALASHNVSSYIAGVDGSPDTFRINKEVTISNIFRAKGNEAWKVYACRFHYATQPIREEESELHKRNEAFVALTRSRIWCVATGIESPIFDELRTATEQYPNFTFKAFNKSSLKRSTEDDAITNSTSSWKERCPNWENTC
jgi:superfamily I DNA and RNA helicase